MPIQQGIGLSSDFVEVRSGVGRLLSRRNAIFASLLVVSGLSFAEPLRQLAASCWSSAEYSYILLIPVITVGLFFLGRQVIFERVRYCLRAGGPLLLAGCGIAASGALLPHSYGPDVRLCVEILGAAVVWIGCFVLCYGTEASRAGLFPLLFSLLLVPLPEVIIAKPITLVQHWSAGVTGFLFTVTGVPVFRDGLTFSLPHLTFIVAKECSGFHSITALFIASILAGYLGLRSKWKRGLLVLIVLPIVSFTNGFRMYVLAILAAYVNPAFFHGNLHRKGGVLFFALGLVILVLAMRTLGGGLRRVATASPEK